MNKVISIAAVMIGSYLLAFICPWWSIAIAPFIAGIAFTFKSGVHALLGFIGLFLLWGVQAYIASTYQAQDLAIRVGELFNGLSPILLVIITALFSGIIGALAQLSGHLLKKTITK